MQTTFANVGMESAGEVGRDGHSRSGFHRENRATIRSLDCHSGRAKRSVRVFSTSSLNTEETVSNSFLINHYRAPSSPIHLLDGIVISQHNGDPIRRVIQIYLLPLVDNFGPLW